MIESVPPPDAGRLQTPVARILRPLVRLFIRCGMTFPALCDLLRELYVNVAEYDFTLAGKEQTDSRVSLLTGIHRKEVRRLRGAGAPVRLVPASVSRSSMIIARWIAAPEFTDENGAPRPLRRAGDPGDGPTYEDLVELVTRDVRPRAVLDEWLDRGMVDDRRGWPHPAGRGGLRAARGRRAPTLLFWPQPPRSCRGRG